MGRFYSFPSDSTRMSYHSGDNPQQVAHEVKGPDGEVLFTRKVFEPGFSPGLDSDDGLHYSGDHLQRVATEYDRANARTRVIYRQTDGNGKYRGERVVEYDQVNERGDVVVARDRRYF